MFNRIKDMLSRLWFLLFIILVSLILSVKLLFGQSVVHARAMRYAELERQKAATELLEKDLAEHAIARHWYSLGKVQLTGDLDKALASFEKGIALDGEEPLNYVGKGLVMLLRESHDEGMALIQKSLTMSRSKNTEVLLEVSDALLQAGEKDSKIIRYIELSEAITGASVQSQLLLGDAYLLLFNDGGKAVSAYERAAQIAPASATPHFKIGMVFLRARNFQEAIVYFNKALSVDPDYTPAYKELGEVYYLQKDGERAVAHYREYLARTEAVQDAKKRLAFALFMAKDFAKAEQIFRELLTGVGNVVLKKYLAISLYEQGKFVEARNHLISYVELADTVSLEAQDYSLLGKTLVKMNEDSLAIKYFSKSIGRNFNQPEIHSQLAEVYFKNKNFVSAINNIQTVAVQRGRITSQECFTLGKSYYFLEQFVLADSVFTKLIKLQPSSHVGFLWKARAKASLDPDSALGTAKPLYEKVVEVIGGSQLKFKKETIEAYSYLAYYYFLTKNHPMSKQYWQKVLTLNPDDLKAKQALKEIQ